ncbi:MAG: dUTP diphosphatase [Ruminococcaceae bacterium]|nr:dUTP diphosphatase [Oscillospiraceae bacterium]
MNIKQISVKKLDDTAILPVYSSAYAAGADLYSLPSAGDVTIPAGKTAFVHTGVAMAIPDSYVGLVCARSGLACKSGLAPANKVGVIDSDYRGEIMVALHNHGDTDRTVCGGDRVAQLLIIPVEQAVFHVVDDLDDTQRGEGGFGSTGA